MRKPSVCEFLTSCKAQLELFVVYFGRVGQDMEAFTVTPSKLMKLLLLFAVFLPAYMSGGKLQVHILAK